MLKTIGNMLVGAILTFAAMFAVSAIAVVGTPPEFGFQLVDGQWLRGMAGGQNFSFQSGITARAGGTQATCTNITIGVYLVSVDTVASTGDPVCLPFALAGTNLNVRNAGAQQMNLFAQPGTNAATATTDNINGTSNSTNYTLPANNIVECFAAKNGSWSCVKGS